jgi:hypothetical protein
MRIFNHTRIPDTVLCPVLRAAGRAAGCSSFPVKVTTGRKGWRFTPSRAHRASRVAEWHMKSQPRSIRNLTAGKWIACPAGGYVTLIVRPWKYLDPLRWAEGLYHTMVHEAKHVADFRDRRRFEYRPQWENRPQERRAEKKADQALQRPGSWQDAVLNLALWAEQKGKTPENDHPEDGR